MGNVGALLTMCPQHATQSAGPQAHPVQQNLEPASTGSLANSKPGNRERREMLKEKFINLHLQRAQMDHEATKLNERRRCVDYDLAVVFIDMLELGEALTNDLLTSSNETS